MTPTLYGLCMTKNEEDIIEFCLEHAARFCRNIFVLDNGSTDSTWDRIQALGRRNEKVVAFEQKDCRYGVGLRGYIFNRVRQAFRDGDWILLLDSDEFLEKDPGEKLTDCARRGVDIIFTLQAQFYITPKDLENAWYCDRHPCVRSFRQMPTHYLINWREPRLFRYNASLKWPDMAADGHPSQISYPAGLQKRWTTGVVNRHYQYRSRVQMQRRLALRAEVHQATGRFKHNRLDDPAHYLRDGRRLKKAMPGEPIKATAMDYLRLYLIKQSRWLRRYLTQRSRLRR